MDRKQNQHLTAAEIETLRQCYAERMGTFDASCMVDCSQRVAAKYYRIFRGYPLARGRAMQPKEQPAAKRPLPSRFYTSSFEL